MQGQSHHVFLNAKQLKILDVHVDDGQEFLFELFFRDVDVSVIHLHRADAHQAEQLARLLVAITRAVLRQADRQVPVRPALGAEDLVVHGTVHRLDVILHAFDLHRWIHALGIIGKVAGMQKEIFLRHHRRSDTQVACLFLHLLSELFELLDHHAAVRQPEGQAGTDLVVEHVDLKIAAQLAVVALLGFFQLMEVVLQLLGIFPGRAVDALEHLILLVAAPVGTGNVHQLEGILLDLLRTLDMRPAAQVRERVVLVDRDLRLFPERIAVFVEAAFFQAFDEFQLVGLVGKDLLGFLRREDRLFELMLALDDLAHPLFDLLQVLRCEVARQVEIIIETVLDRRTDRVLGLRNHFHNGLGHDVSGRVADLVQIGLFVFSLDLL